MKITLISKAETKMSGLYRYTASLVDGLHEIGENELNLVHSPALRMPGFIKRVTGADLIAFFASYPLHCSLDPSQVYHLTNQNLATLLLFQRIRPAVITVMDIIPHLVRNQTALNTFRNPADRLFYALSLRGLRRAQAIIAISEYTRQSLIQHLRIPPKKIRVVHCCVDAHIFRPLPITEEFLHKYALKRELQYILYVGSDDPRKNLTTLVEAFAKVRRELPQVRLLKAGATHFPKERSKLLEQIAQLGLGDQIFLLDQVPEEDLPQLYNAASVFVLPSWYEGFGLPALEAMACGIPAVVSNTTALPEVVGADGRLFAPSDADALADHLLALLRDPDCREAAGRKALARAQVFSPAHLAQATLEVYHHVTRLM